MPSAKPAGLASAWVSRYGSEIMAESLAARLADLRLPDADGNVVRLGSLWESGPGVLVFLRHYG